MTYATRPAGDYKTYGYAGDPGWLSAIWKGVKAIFKPTVKQVAIGALGGAVGGAVMAPAAPPVPVAPPPGTIGGAVSFPGGVRVSGAFTPGALVPHAALAGHTPSGYHLDKATRSRWVRNRRMNVANPRALRKAMRRVQGFEKLAKRTISFTKRVRMK